MSSPAEVLVPIRTVCAMYGLNANTLRAWERRYGIIAPRRGEGGQRGYAPADIDRIRDMVEMTRAGVAPAAAADSLRKQRQTAPNPDRGLDAWKRKLMTAIESLSPELLLKHCAEVEAAVGYQRAMESVVFTQLAALGERWHETAGAIAQEHCATLALRAYMTERFLRRGGESSKPASRKPHPTITLACVPGEAHDLPILHLANLLVDSGGIRPMVLAAGLPLKEILTTAEVMNSSLILLSGTMPVSPLELREWIAELESAGWEKKCVLAGSAFNNSRIFSESAVRAAAGNYTQAVELLLKLQTNNAD